MRYIIFLSLLLPISLQAITPADSLPATSKYRGTGEGLSFRSSHLILPAALISLGIYGAIDKGPDRDIQRQTLKWKGDTMVDDVLVFLPGSSIYLLDWCGVESKHSFRDKTVIAATAAALTLGSTQLLKMTTRVERPDESDRYSFPSQHTAVAFAGAELLWQEYKHHSPWYGMAGYGVAACTGFLRIYNNKHWTSDVLAGAGIGILSAKAAYWLYPSLRKLYVKPDGQSLTVLPFGSTSSLGVSLSLRF